MHNFHILPWLVHKYNGNTVGIMLMLIGCCSYSLMYCLIRLLGESMHPMILLFYRNFLSLIMVWPFAARSFGHWNVFRSLNWQNLIRGLLGFITMSLLTTALSKGVVTDIVAIGFLMPIWTCLLAVLIFRERITLSKTLALITGLVGCYLIMQPQHRVVDKELIMALIATFTWALALIIVKNLLKKQAAATIVFHLSWMTFVLTLPWVSKHQYWPNVEQWQLIAIMAVLSNVAQFMMTKAYEISDVTVVMPFDFTRLIFTALIAYAMFGEVLQEHTVAGALVITLGGYVLLREARAVSAPSA